MYDSAIRECVVLSLGMAIVGDIISAAIRIMCERVWRVR